MRLGLILPAGREPQAARLADDHGLFGVLVEGGQAGHEAVVAGQVAAVTEAVRPLRHAGRRWRVPAGLDGHATLEAVSVTPKPAQVDLPVWLGGAAAAALAATTGLAKVVTELADARPERLVQPAAARLAGELEADRAAVLAWAGAGATHLLLRLPDGAPLDAAVATVSRHLAPEVAMPHFPRLLAEG